MAKTSLSTARTILPGSEKKPPTGKKEKPVPPSDSIEVTVRIRRKKSIENALSELEATGKIYTRDEYVQQFGLSDDDVKKVNDFAAAYGLSVIQTSYSRRSMMLSGSAENMSRAFGTKLNYYTDKTGHQFRGRSGSIKIPQALEGIVTGVFGLDNRKVAKPKFRSLSLKRKNDALKHASSFYPTELASIYNFPKADGRGQCIGIIELSGGHTLRELRHYFSKVGVPMPEVRSVSVGGAHNHPGGSADDEVMLDIEVAGAIAPAATIVVYYCHNTDKGFLDAITQAIHDNINKPSVISISWGGAENCSTKQSLINYNEAFKAAALLGVTICAAAGDDGSDDGQGDNKAHCDFPASSPFVLACGGTKLTTNNGAVAQESVWKNVHVDRKKNKTFASTGGGVSDFFALPDYQQHAQVPLSVNKTHFKGRGVPDLSGVADPSTGYKVYYHSRFHIIGGTSAVAPLMAGLIARINQLKQKTVGFIHPKIYQAPAAFRDIIIGDNITSENGKGYKATAGYDCCTGLGVADGKKLLNIF